MKNEPNRNNEPEQRHTPETLYPVIPIPNPETLTPAERDAAEMAQDQLRRIFKAFPQYRDWAAKTEDPVAMFAAWSRMLCRLAPSDLGVAVDQILDGRLKMPEAYERDQLPIKLLSYAGRIAQDRRKTEAERLKIRRLDEIRQARDATRPRFRFSAADVFTETCKLDNLLSRGEITHAECASQKAEWFARLNEPAD